jgi:hypothetical protein
MRTKNQESAKISMGHLVKRDTCLSRPQAKRVGGAPAIRHISESKAGVNEARFAVLARRNTVTEEGKLAFSASPHHINMARQA